MDEALPLLRALVDEAGPDGPLGLLMRLAEWVVVR